MATVELEVPPRSPYVGVVRLALASLGRSAGLDEETIDDLKIAVSEACSNAVLAMEEALVGPPIKVRWSEHADDVVVEVVDPTDALQDVGVEALDSGGFSSRLVMSMALLETLVDRCQIEPVGDGGVVTRLVVARSTEV